MRVRQERFADGDALRELALRELLYADDMLDPMFGYRPALPPEVTVEHARAELVRDRFSALWDARIRGKMARLTSGEIESEPDGNFAKAFKRADEALLRELFRSAVVGELATYDDLMGRALAGVPIVGASECRR